MRRYGFHEGFENVEKPGRTELIVEMELKLLAKEERFKKLLKGVMEEVPLINDHQYNKIQHEQVYKYEEKIIKYIHLIA